MVPVLLIPGMLCTVELFSPQLAALWPYAAVTVASTLEGETIAAMAEAILATAPPRFALVGMSLGGFIAFEILRQAPQRVVKLALLSTSARPNTPEETIQFQALVAQARSGDFGALLAQALTAILHPSKQSDVALQEVNVRMGLIVGVEGFARQVEALNTRADSRPGLAAISVPTLVLVGDSDPLQPPNRAQEIASAIPGARLVTIPECGHGCTLEQPEAVNRALIEWIAA